MRGSSLNRPAGASDDEVDAYHDENDRERECHACGGVPTFREGALLYPCSDCGEDCCSTCLADGRGVCPQCMDHIDELELEREEQLERDGCFEDEGEPRFDYDTFNEGGDDDAEP